MFENRRRQKRNNAVLVIVCLILLSAFGFGYFLNYGGSEDISKNTALNNGSTDYRIPDSIKNSNTTGAVIPKVDAASDEPQDRSANANPDNFITPNTKVIFRTYFTECSHIMDKEPENPKEFVNLTEEELKIRFSDWMVNEFSPQQVILTREIRTYCPKHYIIGAKDGYIAIYVYNSEGKKVLYEETETSISTLTPEDQKNLEYGIVADSEDELQQKLEGFSE